jgi:hypothetical protein
MRMLAFLSALLGVVAGLLFGMLVWGGATESAVPAADAGASPALLDELRAIHALLEQQQQVARVTAAATAAAVPVVPLSAPDVRVPLDELKAALDGAVAQLRDVSTADTSLTAVEIDPQAPANRTALLESTKIGTSTDVSELFGLSRREVYRRFGPPTRVHAGDGVFRWIYEVEPGAGGTLTLTFSDGCVVWVWRGDGD